MHPSLYEVAASQGGVFTTQQAYAVGYSKGELAQLHRAALHRVRRGVYADRSAFGAASSEQRHLIELHGLALKLRPPYVISHVSAAVVHQLLLYEPSLARLHVTREMRAGARHEAGVEHHVAAILADEVVEVSGLAVTSVARTAIDYARDVDYARAVVTLDAVLRHGVAVAELRAVHERCGHWNGARTAGRALAFADGRSESVGESLARMLFARHGLPAPELQHVIHTRRGAYRVDFLFAEGRTVVEFDGLVKYAVGPELSREDAARVLVQEKLREDAIRDAGYEVVRLVWADLFHPYEVLARIHAACARGSRLGALAG